MRKKMAALLCAVMLVSGVFTSAAADTVLTAKDVTVKSETGVTLDGTIKKWNEGGYVGFKVNMTGVKSVSMEVDAKIVNWTNGEAFRIRLDDPYKGAMLGYVIINKSGNATWHLNIAGSYEGEHTLYVVQNYHVLELLEIKSITLSDKTYTEEKRTPVSDDVIIDNYHDTWVATDSLGRSLADYSEAGPVKEGTHKVGIFYWTALQIGKSAIIAKDVIAEYPEAKEDFYHKAWEQGTDTSIYWGEPLLGFYSSNEYWVYRRHAVMLANAGVDFILFDCTNADRAFVEYGGLCFEAFGDARASGVNAPKISLYTPGTKASVDNWHMMEAAYLNFFADDRYSDLWFTVEGKPLIVAGEWTARMGKSNKEDTAEQELREKIENAFTVRGFGDRQNGPKNNSERSWIWLENYPQYEWGIGENVRAEFMSLGTAINHSYEIEYEGTGVFSDPYVKGRSYTEAFGEDSRPGAVREGYFFAEQASRVLDCDPEYVFITGWNEWHTPRIQSYNGQKNVFIDLFDDENSRDIEPGRGELGDDYYNQMIDFIRKYKGVRPAPVASGMKTIDINADASAWDTVGPEFINDIVDYERDASPNRDRKTGEYYHYTTKVKNAIIRVKATFDSDNIYFMAKTKDAIKDGDNFMQIFINTDRNRATGWEGYDYAVNLLGKGVLSKFPDGSFDSAKIGDIEQTVSGSVLQVKIPRSFLDETGTIDLEFKIADGINVAGDVLNFYIDGSSAPMGRYNYLFTEIAGAALSESEKTALDGAAIVKAGSGEMIAAGGIMKLYEPDTRVTAFSENGTVYVPARALGDIMGYGETKTEWADVEADVLVIKNHDMNDRTITNNNWMWTKANSCEARVNGYLKALSNPVKVVGGIPYVPVSLLSECFGFNVADIGGGAFAVSRNRIDNNAATAAAAYIK